MYQIHQTLHKKTRFLEHKFSRIMILNTGLGLVIVQRIKNVDVCSTCWERPQMALVRCTAQKWKMQNAKKHGCWRHMLRMTTNGFEEMKRLSHHNYGKKLQTKKMVMVWDYIDFFWKIGHLHWLVELLPLRWKVCIQRDENDHFVWSSPFECPSLFVVQVEKSATARQKLFVTSPCRWVGAVVMRPLLIWMLILFHNQPLSNAHSITVLVLS